MNGNPYSRFRGQRLSLNDYLAIDRTVLANERTLLAYGRTALALAVVGGTCVKFMPSAWMQGLGFAFVAAGVLVAVRGGQRFVQTRRRLAAALGPEPPDTPAAQPESADARPRSREGGR